MAGEERLRHQQRRVTKWKNCLLFHPSFLISLPKFAVCIGRYYSNIQDYQQSVSQISLRALLVLAEITKSHVRLLVQTRVGDFQPAQILPGIVCCVHKQPFHSWKTSLATGSSFENQSYYSYPDSMSNVYHRAKQACHFYTMGTDHIQIVRRMPKPNPVCLTNSLSSW